MPDQYADIAFPTAARQVFTYRVPPGMPVEPGMRVWVPLRNEKVIGMVVRVHGRKPAFKTRTLLRVLDREPVMSPVLLQLTEWIHRFYYCSWGEAIQAALPVGLNFVSEKKLRISPDHHGSLDHHGKLKERELEMIEEIEASDLRLEEARKRWRDAEGKRLLQSLIKRGVVEIWEEPKQKVGYKTAKHWEWAGGTDREAVIRLADRSGDTRWTVSLRALLDIQLPAAHQNLIQKEEFSDYTLRRIEKEGLIISKNLPVSTLSGRVQQNGSPDLYEPDRIVSLAEEQQEVFTEIREALDKESFKSFLLYGVTGSGKTEVYIHALKHVLSKGRGGMILVPEIALTPQTVRRFYRIFGDRIAVLHSRLNERERYEAWKGLRSGEKQIVIGPRSAVFAPVQNLGMIVVDEEHDSSYKQFDPSPRYHARDTAIMRAHMEEAVVVMGSATPSMASLHGARSGKHSLLKLSTRPGGSLPFVKILDMKQYGSAMKGPFTVELFEAVRQALSREEQVIILYNRRGFASYLLCRECGHIPLGPDSSVSLTWHKSKNMLLCHYTGYSRKAETRCLECGSGKLSAMGRGTQQIEDEIGELFPEARLLRMDRDTTSGKFAHRKIYEQFLNGGADILIGTQLVSKGLDFPNVTVVGVLGIETELAFPSFRSGERLYQLLSQVAGRAGRGEKTGNVYVQTWKPEHRSVRFARDHDYWSFSENELSGRKNLGYPPFSRMLVFHFKGESEPKTRRVAEVFSEAIREETAGRAVLGPSPGVIERVHGLWQWETHVKIKTSRNAGAIEELINRIHGRYGRMKPPGSSPVRITVDVDAIE